MKRASERGFITVTLSLQDIRTCSTGRLEVLVQGCRGSLKLAKAVQGAVVLQIPSCFKGTRQRETCEHPEIAAFAKAVIRRCPGFSLLVDFKRDLTYKHLLLSNLSVLTFIRKGEETTLRFPESEWDELVKEEVRKAGELARRLGLPTVIRDAACMRIREALDEERF
jgi:hypothetical protein